MGLATCLELNDEYAPLLVRHVSCIMNGSHISQRVGLDRSDVTYQIRSFSITHLAFDLAPHRSGYHKEAPLIVVPPFWSDGIAICSTSCSIRSFSDILMTQPRKVCQMGDGNSHSIQFFTVYQEHMSKACISGHEGKDSEMLHVSSHSPILKCK